MFIGLGSGQRAERLGDTRLEGRILEVSLAKVAEERARLLRAPDVAIGARQVESHLRMIRQAGRGSRSSSSIARR